MDRVVENRVVAPVKTTPDPVFSAHALRASGETELVDSWRVQGILSGKKIKKPP